MNEINLRVWHTSGEFKWDLKTDKSIDAVDMEFLRNYNPVLYWNDIECYHWIFAFKLPSGRWVDPQEITDHCATFKGFVD